MLTGNTPSLRSVLGCSEQFASGSTASRTWRGGSWTLCANAPADDLSSGSSDILHLALSSGAIQPSWRKLCASICPRETIPKHNRLARIFGLSEG